MEPKMHSTTILAVKRNEQVAIAGDGQVTLDKTIMKHSAHKVRRIYHDKIGVGFAGSAADAQALTDRFEAKLEEMHGNLLRAVIDFGKEWRTDRAMRRLEAMIIVTDGDTLLILSGNGDIVEPDDGIAAIGSGGPYAQAAAKALIANTDLSAEKIVRESMRIASEICIYTNGQVNVEVIEKE